MQALVKCTMKIKEEEFDHHIKYILMKGGLYKAVLEDWLSRFQ